MKFCTPTPQTNVPTKYQLPTPYGFQDIAQTRFSNSSSLRQGQRSNQGHTMTLHTYTTNQCPYQVSTSYTLQFPRYSPDKIFKLKVTTARSKVKSRSHHDVAHLHPQPMSYQISTSYTLRFPRHRPDKPLPDVRPPTHPDTMGENNTPKALKGCGVKKLLKY